MKKEVLSSSSRYPVQDVWEWLEAAPGELPRATSLER